ncbi:MAG TPA: hypothetical protein VF276_10070 [Chloroflexia bacterium]
MNTPSTNVPGPAAPPTHDDRWIGGAILIGIGLLAFISQYGGPLVGGFALLAAGLVFLVAGSMSRRIGLLIPGGILTGLGVGVALITGPFAAYSGEATGAVILLSFAGGWVLITALSAVFTDKLIWWPLIPGGVLGLVGASLLAGENGIWLLQALGWVWPLVLIALGVYLIIRRNAPAHR